ncbi:MAG: VPLPA-CTERM sorting domain-containing protein [Chromatiales bacterium]|jgi:hypothetical protein|nr:MAG: VPLPA-CTERM sorting domain-containing protein [Chromatiales bacterium]
MDTAIRNLLPTILLLLGCQTVTASTWTFASGGDYYSTSGSSYGNQITFSQGLETLQVSALSNTADTPVNSFETAYIKRFSTGLGVCNREEGSISYCLNTNAIHQVDNVGQQDLVLFLFDSQQAMQSLTIDPYGVWDRDVSFWVGNVSPSLSLSGSTFANLGALGFGSQMNSLNGASDAALTISLGGYMGNALLVGGLFPADGTPDRFKIRSLVTNAGISVVPVPAGAWLLLSGFGVLAGLRRRPA